MNIKIAENYIAMLIPTHVKMSNTIMFNILDFFAKEKFILGINFLVCDPSFRLSSGQLVDMLDQFWPYRNHILILHGHDHLDVGQRG